MVGMKRTYDYEEFYKKERPCVGKYKQTIIADFFDFVFRKCKELLVKAIQKPFGITLDSGCGEGTFTKFLASNSKLYVGLDIALRACKGIKENCQSLSNAPLLNGAPRESQHKTI